MPDNVDIAVDIELRNELAALIVESLDLEEITAEDIDPAAPLFGEGLCLDSIDALELSFEIARKYNFNLRSDDERNEEIFASLTSLAQHIAENRKN